MGGGGGGGQGMGWGFDCLCMRARSGKSGKSWRPLTRVSVDFTVLSSNFVYFSVF